MADQIPSTTNSIDAGATTDARGSLQQQATSRLAAARQFKSFIELDVKECYFLSAPNRQRQINSQTSPSIARMLDAPELNTDEAYIVVEDFVTALIGAFMPEAELWCERGPGMDLPGGKDGAIWKQVKDQVKADDLTIFNAMKASNLYPELPKAMNPDIAIGTAAVWIDRPHPAHAIVVSAIPFRELEIDLGPYGEIDYRAAVRFTRNHYIEELVGPEVWAVIPADIKNKRGNKPTDRTQIIWAFWRDWEDHTDEVWQKVIMLDNEVIFDDRLHGEGSCPLNPFRFGATADWPHGFGPLMKGLPTLRQIDEFEYMRTRHASLSINPPITYPDDSFAAVEQGVEEGMAYPIRPGSEGAVKAIYTVPPPEVANYQYEEKVKKLRKLHFVDYPEQTGDTPPTLGQWLDEMARAQRRLGTPGLGFWREGPAQIFLRFKWLLEKSGSIKPIRVDGRAVATMPRNPAQAAAEQQEVGMAMKIATYLAQTFPEEFKIAIDGTATMKEFVAKARVSLLKFRDPQHVAQAVQQMSQLVGDRPVPGATNQTPGPAA